MLLASFIWPMTGRAQMQWDPVIEPAESGHDNDNTDRNLSWDDVPPSSMSSADLVWEPLTPEQANTAAEDLVWSEPTDPSLDDPDVGTEGKHDSADAEQPEAADGLRWPNGQLMSAEDQRLYSTAYSRGSMIQIGETVYPNLGFNALQRHPDSWVNAALVVIDDSRITGADCRTGDFLDQCADGILDARVRLWNSPAMSFDLHWTMQSLSGRGSPINFTVGGQTFGEGDDGTKFGEGQSIGLVLSKNLGKTFGLTFAGYRLFHFDENTDLARNFALFGTKVFRLNDTLEPPIISVSLGLMSDVFNNETNLGTISYPEFLRGGLFPSIFADRYDNKRSGYVYYPDVAGVSSAFVCADRSIFAGKPVSAADENCIHQVYVGPIASIGFAPWPWFGIYAKYSGTDIDLGVSLKPFKSIPWTISLEALNPIKGVNPTLDQSFDLKECRNRDNATFSDCRTRVGIYTELAF